MVQKTITIMMVELLLVMATFFFPAWIGLWDFPLYFLGSLFFYFVASIIFFKLYFQFFENRNYWIITTIKTMIVYVLVFSCFLIQGGRLLGYQIFHIPTASMTPTLLVGDFVIVNTHRKDYDKLDVIVFRHSENTREIYFVKRITHVKEDIFHGKKLDGLHYAVMGDNRDESFDSRIFGAIEKEGIVGKVVWIAASYNKQWKMDRFLLVIK